MDANNSPTVFTDDELRELENDLDGRANWCIAPISVRGIRKLLVRLRAAEKAASWFNQITIDYPESEPYKDFKKWLTACGKDK